MQNSSANNMNIINTKVINGNIQVLNDYIIKGRPKTALNDDISSGVAAITVFSINGFEEGNYYALIGKIGSGNAELIKMHASTAPTGNTITLAANLVNDHDANEPVYFLQYNQIEFNHSTSTSIGDADVTTPQDIDPTSLYTSFIDSNTTGYALNRFKNEAGTTYSSYSSASPYLNPKFNTVEYIINQAMRETKQTEDGEPLFTDDLTVDYLIDQVNECVRDIRKNKDKLSWTQSFRTVLGQTASGVFKYTLPTNIYDKYSYKCIEAIRINSEVRMERVEPNYFFDIVMNSINYTQVRTIGVVGAVTLEIDNSYDFDDSGTILVGTQEITYTGVTRSETAGVLTGVPATGTGSIVTQIEVDDYIFQGASTGEPVYWTIYNGSLYVWNIPSSTWLNKNIYLDYFKTTTEIDSLDDAIDYIQYDMIKNWLKWKIIAMEKNDGILNLEDSSYLLYREQLNILIKKDRNLNTEHFRSGYEFQGNDLDINPRQIRDGDARRL